MLDKFEYGYLNTVYNYDDYTQLEINSKLIQKINEVIENCNQSFDYIDYLKEQGITDEVENILNAMLENGLLKNTINIAIVNNLKTEINDLKKEINMLKTEINNIKKII